MKTKKLFSKYPQINLNMKTIKTLLVAVILIISSISCNKEDTPQETPNKAPTCEITAPNNGQEFTQGETITISVNAEDSDGNITEVKFFIDGVEKSSANSSPYNYNWNTTGENTGSYTLKATSFDNDGSKSSDELSVKLIAGNGGEAPIANFSATPTSGTAPLNVNFSDESENNPISWQWDFGDGNTSTQQNPSYTYNDDGNYTVSLIVSNNDGSDTKTKTNYINVDGGTAGTFTDPRDGQTYDLIEIGTQIWFAENINYEIGDSWWYEDNSAYGDIYGRLYTWDAALNACPSGWHLPTDDEWTVLTDFLGGEPVAGGKMKETGTTHWNSPNTGATNSSGFTGLPGGNRTPNGWSGFLGDYGRWWSSTEDSGYNGWARNLNYSYVHVWRFGSLKASGYSVRCLKD